MISGLFQSVRLRWVSAPDLCTIWGVTTLFLCSLFCPNHYSQQDGPSSGVKLDPRWVLKNTLSLRRPFDPGLFVTLRTFKSWHPWHLFNRSTLGTFSTLAPLVTLALLIPMAWNWNQSQDYKQGLLNVHFDHIQYCTVLYCTETYCTVLYCTIPYCTGPYCYLPCWYTPLNQALCLVI